MIRLSLAPIVVVSLLFAGCASGRYGPKASTKAPEGPHTLKKLSLEERQLLLQRAHVWQPIATSSLNLAAGPDLPAAMRIGQLTMCTFVFPDKPLTGNTPKFLCEIRKGDAAKVKYDAKNGEVYGEVAATRLLWALGFKSDVMVPTLISCRGCPPDPFTASTVNWSLGNPADTATRTFEPAVIERPIAGRSIEVDGFEGWAWPELDKLGQRGGGATRAEIDAFKLLAVFIQHSDSKPDQQDIICGDTKFRIDGQGNETCGLPWLVIKDLGATFGKATRLNSSKMTLADWDSVPVWKDAAQCVGDLPRSVTGSLENPKISEAGRRFLAQRLRLLKDRQLRDLFAVANVERRGETLTGADGSKRKVTIDDWVRVFKKKRSEIVAAHCPA
ncbi:MAG: hypothetical protein ABI665_06160 [Vicinamibacterales bacterium]